MEIKHEVRKRDWFISFEKTFEDFAENLLMKNSVEISHFLLSQRCVSLQKKNHDEWLPENLKILFSYNELTIA